MDGRFRALTATVWAIHGLTIVVLAYLFSTDKPLVWVNVVPLLLQTLAFVAVVCGARLAARDPEVRRLDSYRRFFLGIVVTAIAFSIIAPFTIWIMFMPL
jgi:hypothetical protein